MPIWAGSGDEVNRTRYGPTTSSPTMTRVPPPGPRFLGNVLIRRARIEGFIVMDYQERYHEAFGPLKQWMAEGRLKYKTDVVDGLEQAPAAVNRLFSGANTGKLLVKVSDDPGGLR